MAVDPEDLSVVKAYFEEVIGCVVGCGCWERGWDAAPAVVRFAETSAESPRDETSPFANDVLETLTRLVRELRPEDMEVVYDHLELRFRTPGEFREFFAPSI